LDVAQAGLFASEELYADAAEAYRRALPGVARQPGGCLSCRRPVPKRRSPIPVRNLNQRLLADIFPGFDRIKSEPIDLSRTNYINDIDGSLRRIRYSQLDLNIKSFQYLNWLLPLHEAGNHLDVYS
jgi:hypothetical protein